jgi:hypothetical protein
MLSHGHLLSHALSSHLQHNQAAIIAELAKASEDSAFAQQGRQIHSRKISKLEAISIKLSRSASVTFSEVNYFAHRGGIL